MAPEARSSGSEPRPRPGGFASALERLSELQRKAELGRTRGESRGAKPALVGGRGRSWGRSLEAGLEAESGWNRGAGRSLTSLLGSAKLGETERAGPGAGQRRK